MTILINIIINTIIIISIITLVIYYITLGTQQSIPYIYRYKIDHFMTTVCIIVIYLLFNIIFIYALRLFYLGHILDLNLLYNNIRILYAIFIMPLSLLFKFYIGIIIIIIILYVTKIFILIYQRISLDIFKFYIYRYGKTQRLTLFFIIGDFDIISYFIYKIFCIMQNNVSNQSILFSIINFIIFVITTKQYKIIIKISPIIIFIYDCIYNDFIILYFYYYMLLYVPLMLLQKISKTITETNSGFVQILWNIYYDNNSNNTFYIANVEEKNIMDIFVMSNVSYIPELSLEMVEYYLKGSITYKLIDQEQCLYVNNDGNYLKIENNKIYTVIEDEEGNITYKETEEYVIL